MAQAVQRSPPDWDVVPLDGKAADVGCTPHHFHRLGYHLMADIVTFQDPNFKYILHSICSFYGERVSRLRPFVAGPKMPIPITMENIAAPIITNTAWGP